MRRGRPAGSCEQKSLGKEGSSLGSLQEGGGGLQPALEGGLQGHRLGGKVLSQKATPQ